MYIYIYIHVCIYIVGEDWVKISASCCCGLRVPRQSCQKCTTGRQWLVSSTQPVRLWRV